MQNFILLTRLIRDEVHPSLSIEETEKQVTEKIEEYLPEVKWVSNYVILGPWDYVDIFEAPDMRTAMKLSTLVRYYGGAHTEIWPAMEWNSYEKTIRELAEVVEK
jgi:uncharacterized protein with GYD domain